MLILAHADGPGVNFDQFRQRILQAAGNGSRAALPHVKIGEFFRGQLAGGINGSPGLADDHVLERLSDFFDQIHNNLFRLPGSGSVAQGNQGNPISVDQFFQLFFGFFHPVLGRGGINHLRGQHFPGRIHDRQLAAGPESRVPAKHHPACHRGLHQQLLQIFPEDADCPFLRLFRQLIADLPFNGRGDQTAVAVCQRLL